MGTIRDMLGPATAFAGEVLAETLWPTRCAICDAPGKVLCDRCRFSLPYLDWWRACRRCGAAYGYVQCCGCNPVAMEVAGRDAFPFEGCASATMFDEDTGKIVRVYKDQGERRLAADMAALMAQAIPPDWPYDAVTYVPASLAAYRRRGFDHAETMARELSGLVGKPLVRALDRPRTRDQRKLTGAQRRTNLANRFHARRMDLQGVGILLVDDVFTTGSTLCAASDALLDAGVEAVYCSTFARV